MTCSEEIKVLCAKLNISSAEVARRLGQSPQSFNAKMHRNTFTVSDMEKIADVCNATYVHDFRIGETL